MATLTTLPTVTRTVTTIGVLGTGAYVPERIVSNDEVGAPAGVDDAWIHRKTGIRERHWASPDQATSDLATAAGRVALEHAGISADQITQLVVATSTPDHPQPPTAAIVQTQLGAVGSAAYDLNAVCAGFEFAMNTVSQSLSLSGGYGLVIGADIYSRILNPVDRRTVILFGDGGGAVVLGPTETPDGAPAPHARGAHEILATKLLTIGHMSELVGVHMGGSRMPYCANEADAVRYFHMDGRGVRNFIVNEIPGIVREFLAEENLECGDIRHLIPHQANAVMLEELYVEMAFPNMTNHISSVTKMGNTGAASIPIALAEVDRQNVIEPGQLVLLAGIGGGLSIGLTVLRW